MFARAGIKHKQRLDQKGFSVVEALLSVTLFCCLTTALVGAIVYGRQSAASAGDHNRAVLLADEGCDAVRNIGAAAWSNLSIGNFGLAVSGGQWTFSGTSDTTGIYTRQINIAQVDSDRKTVTCTVSWTASGAPKSLSVTTRLTNWSAPIVTPGPIMMAYSKTTTTPFYRIWNGSSWGTEGSANNVGGTINYVVLKSARTRNEAILGTQDATGAIFVQVWNGSSWGAATQVGTGPTGTRAFDIAYEKNSDRAVIVYSPSAASADFAYRIWNGTTLSSPITITAPPTTGAINWIELDQNPLSSSDEVAMIMLDANSDVYGMRWTGSAWDNMGTATTWDTTASTSFTKKAIDVEYEQTSGHALYVWGDATATDNNYRTWDGTTLGAVTTLAIPTEGGISEWVQLAARPGSNQIMLGVQDAGADLNTRIWSGTAWDTAAQHPEHDASTENILSRNFDIVWETATANLGKAWLVWGDGSTISTSQWNGTSWGTTSTLSGSDDTSFIRLRADPVSGTLFTGNYQNASSAVGARDISERHIIGGGSTWTTKNIIWGGATSSDPVYFRIDIAIP
ncbi:MAG TPA: hypothetical protein VLF91_05185 [Candidatus Saccharimonadales bacterium]|nr:hypothetical protein [Candidatus Saccharimonadales bacterium]